MKKLLLIVDAQYDFLVGGNLPVEGAKDNIGKIVNVEITDVKTWSMDGEVVD